ncbi:MAG: acyl-CoA thioesterase [Bdellovibrio sp.]|nr:acyl-CoA thioesterase [Bdellovibrio sp.]
MAEVYKSQANIKFHQADPAGIMFFANVFTLAHDAYEAFIQTCGFTWKEWFLDNKYLIPIRHTEADYLRPFLAGETYEIQVRVIEFSSSSFRLQYDFLQGAHKHAVVRMVHTCIDPKTFQKSNLPDVVKTKLQPFHHETTT